MISHNTGKEKDNTKIVPSFTAKNIGKIDAQPRFIDEIRQPFVDVQWIIRNVSEWQSINEFKLPEHINNAVAVIITQIHFKQGAVAPGFTWNGLMGMRFQIGTDSFSYKEVCNLKTDSGNTFYFSPDYSGVTPIYDDFGQSPRTLAIYRLPINISNIKFSLVDTDQNIKQFNEMLLSFKVMCMDWQ